MIPKIIHYCWFGGARFSDNEERCITSWRNNCPDYQIVRWDETNFNIEENAYVKQAYLNKKWAFVSDYVRLKVLYDYGGVYMDTDVEVIKTYDSLLEHKLFCCFEDDNNVSIGTVGAEKGNGFVRELLDSYKNRTFIKSNKEMDMTTNLKIVTEKLVKDYDLLLDGNLQRLNDGIVIYPKDYFIAKNYKTGEYNITENTYAIHHYNGSWLSDDDKLYGLLYKRYWNRFSWIRYPKFRHIMAALSSVLKHRGIMALMRRVILKIIKH